MARGAEAPDSATPTSPCATACGAQRRIFSRRSLPRRAAGRDPAYTQAAAPLDGVDGERRAADPGLLVDQNRHRRRQREAKDFRAHGHLE